MRRSTRHKYVFIFVISGTEDEMTENEITAQIRLRLWCMRRIKMVLTRRDPSRAEGRVDSARKLLTCVRTIKQTPNLLMYITAAASSF